MVQALISKRGEDFIKGYEKCVLKAYLPTKDDKPTIGWGSTGPDIKLGMVWSKAQADARFDRDVKAFSAGVARQLYVAPTQDQMDALTSLAYNIGLANFANSTVLKRHNEGAFDQAAAAFLMWVKQKGKTLPGLVARRKAEAALYRSIVMKEH